MSDDDKKTNMGMKCMSTTKDCKEPYLKCLKIGKNNKVDICDNPRVDCGNRNKPTGVCYPSSIEAGKVKKLEYVDDNAMKLKEESKKTKANMIAMIAGFSVTTVILIAGGGWLYRKIKHQQKNENVE